MRTTHELGATALCPVNGKRDFYIVKIELNDKIVPVEEIIDEISIYANVEILQENLTQVLASTLKATVETQGLHSSVRTTCTCYP